MAEIGIDISNQHSKSIDEFSDVDIDLAVTFAKAAPKPFVNSAASPMFMGRPEVVNANLHKTKHYLVHGFDDPSEAEGTEEEKLAAFRKIRDEIKKWIIEEFADLNLENLHRGY